MTAWEDSDITSHLESEQVAAYLERRLPTEEQAAVELHLAHCAQCRSELREVSAFVTSDQPRGGRRAARWGLAATAAAAAIALFVFLDRPAEPLGPQSDDVFRAETKGAPESVPRIEVVSPGADARTDTLVFAWRSVSPDALYRLTVTDRAGDVVWAGDITDTTRTLTSMDGIARDQDYLWYVDAVLPDARVATSGMREVRTGP